MNTDSYAIQDGASLRLIDGQHHLGFYQEGVWVDLGRAVLSMTEYEEGTGAYKMMWTVADKDESYDSD